jgi:hypothetical protein
MRRCDPPASPRPNQITNVLEHSCADPHPTSIGNNLHPAKHCHTFLFAKPDDTNDQVPFRCSNECVFRRYAALIAAATVKTTRLRQACL